MLRQSIFELLCVYKRIKRLCQHSRGNWTLGAGADIPQMPHDSFSFRFTHTYVMHRFYDFIPLSAVQPAHGTPPATFTSVQFGWMARNRNLSVYVTLPINRISGWVWAYEAVYHRSHHMFIERRIHVRPPNHWSVRVSCSNKCNQKKTANEPQYFLLNS